MAFSESWKGFSVLDRDDLLRLLVSERGSLIGFIHSLGASREVAEDVFQDLVILVAQKPPRIEDRVTFLSWARTAARFTLQNHNRKKWKKALVLDDVVLDRLESHWVAGDDRPFTDRLSALEECKKLLSPGARQLLELRFVEGLSGDSLAAAAGRTLNAVHVALSRSYRKLADCVEHRLSTAG